MTTLPAPAADTAASTVLGVERLSISFGGLTALDGIALGVAEGEIFALMGPNGAGKTTLFNCVSGVYRPSRGSIRFRGRELVGLAPYQIAALGIARTFQNLELFQGMTVMDNILLGTHCRRRVGAVGEALKLPRFGREEREAVERARGLLHSIGAGLRGDEVASDLPYGLQKQVELLRALAMEPALLLLDEPAAGGARIEVALAGGERRDDLRQCLLLAVGQLAVALHQFVVGEHDAVGGRDSVVRG